MLGLRRAGLSIAEFVGSVRRADIAVWLIVHGLVHVKALVATSVIGHVVYLVVEVVEVLVQPLERVAGSIVIDTIAESRAVL